MVRLVTTSIHRVSLAIKINGGSFSHQRLTKMVRGKNGSLEWPRDCSEPIPGAPSHQPLLVAAGQQTEKLPSVELSRRTCADRPIAVIAGRTLERQVWQRNRPAVKIAERQAPDQSFAIRG